MMFDYAVSNHDSSKRLKSDLNLDINSATSLTAAEIFDGILSTPDMAPGMLKLASPEIEKFLAQQSTFGTSQQICTPSQVLFPGIVTEEQEKYARGFVDALLEMQANGQRNNASFNDSLSLKIDNETENKRSDDVVLKLSPKSDDVMSTIDEDSEQSESVLENISPNGQNSKVLFLGSLCTTQEITSASDMKPVPSFAGVKRNYSCLDNPHPITDSTNTAITIPDFLRGIAPIDMELQEKIKLDRKRARNRLAATKCRERKLERISNLEEQVRQLKTRNVELTELAATLRDTVCQMKLEIITHINGGCQLMMQRPCFL